MGNLNAWAYWLQRVVDVGQQNVQKRYHEKERLTFFDKKDVCLLPGNGVRVRRMS